MFDNSDQSFWPSYVAPAHRADANCAPGDHGPRKCVRAPLIVTGSAALEHGHEPVGDPGVLGAAPGFPVGADRA